MDFVLKNHCPLTLKYFNFGIISDLQLVVHLSYYHLRISSNFHYALKPNNNNSNSNDDDDDDDDDNMSCILSSIVYKIFLKMLIVL